MNTPIRNMPSPQDESSNDSLAVLMNDIFMDSSDEECENSFEARAIDFDSSDEDFETINSESEEESLEEINIDSTSDESWEEINIDSTPEKSDSENLETNTPECCVCFESIGKTNVTTTPCGHTFCFSCLMKCMDVKNNCPYCREPLREESDIIESSDDEYSDDEYDEYSITSEDELTTYDNASNPTLGLTTLNELVTLLDECSISREELLGMLLFRYEDGVDQNSLQKKKQLFNDMTVKKDKEKRHEWEERTSMMEEDTRRNNRIQTPMDIGDGLGILFNEPSNLSLIHPDKLERIIPLHDEITSSFPEVTIN